MTPLSRARPEVDATLLVASTDYSIFDIVDEIAPVVNLPRAHREDETDVGLSPAPPRVTDFDDDALQPSSVGDSLFNFFDETSPSAPIVNLPRAIQANEDDAGPSSVPQYVSPLQDFPSADRSTGTLLPRPTITLICLATSPKLRTSTSMRWSPAFAACSHFA